MFQYVHFALHIGQEFRRSEAASIAVSSALVLPILLGAAGLALEYGSALVTRAETQRVADLAVHAGIVAYGKASDPSAMLQAARHVAGLNGVAAEGVQVTLDPDSSNGVIVRVEITTPRPLILSRVITGTQSQDVTVRAAARLEQAAGEPACVMALDPNGTGITLSGGTSITATECSVSSNATVSVSGGARIVTETVNYDSSTPPAITGGASIVAPGGGPAKLVRTSSADPFADHPAVSLAKTRLEAVATMSAPQMPPVAVGPDIEFGWNTAQTQNQASAVGCTASRAGSVWSFDCPKGTSVQLGNLTIGGGLDLDFGLNGDADSSYSFSGSIRHTGSQMRFGPGTYTIAGGISTGGGTSLHFGAGTFRIGRASVGCNRGAVRYSICNNATISFDGPSVFELEGGVFNSGGGSLVLGAGTGNSYRIGPATSGEAFSLGGGSTTILADASGAAGRFEVVGHTVTGGNSCFVIGAATHHDIAGHLQIAGGIVFGRGLYAIDGYLHLGASGGGSSNCLGESISLRASEATFLLSGKGVSGNNANCNGQAAFCAAGGYSSMRLVAPTSGPFANMAVLGPLAPDVTAGASFAGGARGSQISGAFYFPNGPISLSGGASAGGSSSGCLQLIGARVTLSGGTTAASDCVMAGGGGASVAQIRMIE